MERHELQIALTEKNGKQVHLTSMTADELGSFLTVMGSFKSIVTALTSDEDIRFSIKNGSAAGATYAQKDSIDNIVTGIQRATDGKSDNKAVTDNLRVIQKQFKNDDLKYELFHKNMESQANPVYLHDSIREAKRIQLRRKKRDNNYKIQCRNGKLIEIGGKKPNYHLDFTLGESLTIKCSEVQAGEIVKSIELYNYMTVLVLQKKASNTETKDTYTHKAIIEKRYEDLFLDYLTDYYSEYDFVKQLGITYSFVDTIFDNYKNDESLEILKNLIQAFNDKEFHLSELKTILVVSKPYMHNPIIKEVLEDLFETYKKKREKELQTAW